MIVIWRVLQCQLCFCFCEFVASSVILSINQSSADCEDGFSLSIVENLQFSEAASCDFESASLNCAFGFLI